MKPSGAGAVMADCARGEVEGDDAQERLWRRLNYFPTKPWAARAGGELINEIDPPKAGQRWWCWEPACGDGRMAYGLADYFQHVHATDIHDYGGELQCGCPLDFLSPAADAIDQADWIVTNPPFSLAAEFVQAGLRRAKRGVAILARTAWLDTQGRFAMFFGDPIKGTQALYAIAPFFERVPMTLGGRGKDNTATAYAWFIWMQPGAAADMSYATRRLLALRPEVWPIPLGTRERLTRPEDAPRRVEGAARLSGPERLAREILNGCRPEPLSATPGARYLLGRGIPEKIVRAIGGRLRFNPQAKWGWDEERQGWIYAPAIVGQVRCPAGPTGGVHVTYLAADGSRKAALEPAKRMWGPQRTREGRPGGVWLTEPAGAPLIVGEGIESGLSAAQLHKRALPGWRR
jgi:hypothetical protein